MMRDDELYRVSQKKCGAFEKTFAFYPSKSYRYTWYYQGRMK